MGESVGSQVRDPLPPLGKAQVFVGGGKRNGSGALFEQVYRLEQFAGIAGGQAAYVGRSRGKRPHIRVALAAEVSARDSALGQLVVAHGERHSHQLRLVSQILPKPGEDVFTLYLAGRTEPLVSLLRVPIGGGLEAQ